MSNNEILDSLENKILKLSKLEKINYQVKLDDDRLSVTRDNMPIAEIFHSGSMWKLTVEKLEFMNLGDPDLEVIELLIKGFKSLS